MSDGELTLSTIEQLLRKYENYSHADYIANCRDQLLRDGSIAYRHFATLEWWGGSGSVADVHLHHQGTQHTDAEKTDNRAFRSALIDLYDLMIANGVKMERRATFWADAFREWKKKDI